MFFGIGSAFSSILMGRIIDAMTSRKAVCINVIILIGTAVASIKNVQDGQFGVFSHVTSLVWGLQDGIINTHCFQILSYEFDGQTDPFSVF
jgi:predicted MFS family arabinose efflux permease